MSQPEFWMRGITVEGIAPALQPVAHALLQALEDLEDAASGLSSDALWARPGGAASAGFHLRHLAGSLDRLTTYARGEALSDAQLAALRCGAGAGRPGGGAPGARPRDRGTRAGPAARHAGRVAGRAARPWGARGCRPACAGCCTTPASTPPATRDRGSRRRRSSVGLAGG